MIGMELCVFYDKLFVYPGPSVTTWEMDAVWLEMVFFLALGSNLEASLSYTVF